MKLSEKINEYCCQDICESVKKRKTDGMMVVFGRGGNRHVSQYNLLARAVKHILGTAIIRWNGTERVV